MFFKKLAELLPEKVDLNMTIRNQADELTILITPQHGNSNFVPMSIKGTPEDIDTNFHKSIGECLSQSKELFVKMEAHAKELKKKQAELEEKKKTNENAKTKKPISVKKAEDKGESLFEAGTPAKEEVKDENKDTKTDTDENKEEEEEA